MDSEYRGATLEIQASGDVFLAARRGVSQAVYTRVVVPQATTPKSGPGRNPTRSRARLPAPIVGRFSAPIVGVLLAATVTPVEVEVFARIISERAGS